MGKVEEGEGGGVEGGRMHFFQIDVGRLIDGDFENLDWELKKERIGGGWRMGRMDGENWGGWGKWIRTYFLINMEEIVSLEVWQVGHGSLDRGVWKRYFAREGAWGRWMGRVRGGLM